MFDSNMKNGFYMIKKYEIIIGTYTLKNIKLYFINHLFNYFFY